jgi:hypothetical protein
MPRHVTPDGQIFDAPDHVIAALKTLEDHAALSAPPAPRGPSAAERFDAIRNAQALAMSEGRVLPVPPAPVIAAVAIDPASMTPAQHWGMWRNSGAG